MHEHADEPPVGRPLWSDEIRRRLAGLRLPPEREAEIVEEMSQHLDDRYAECRARGASEEEAVRAALTEVSEDAGALAREMRGVEREAARPLTAGARPTGSVLRDLWHDLRYGARMMRKAPGFTAVAVLTLALGIGANTAIFSVVDAVLLRPLPFTHPERLVRLFRTHPNMPGGRQTLSRADFLALRERSRAFAAVAVYQATDDGFTYTGGDHPEQVFGAFVSADFFTVLGARPLLGRAFAPGDDAPGAPLSVVLGYDFWRQRLSGDQSVIGRTIRLDGLPMLVRGVMPPGFWFPRGDRAELWVNMIIDPPTRLGPFGLAAIARLRPGVTPAMMQADLDAVAAGVRERFPGGPIDWTLVSRPLKDHLVAPVRPALVLLLGAVTLVLVIACVNVANLMLARASGRAPEIAVRTALGASRGRLVRQLLTESALLAALGGGVGLAFAYWGVRALLAIGPGDLPLLRDVPIGVDARVLAVTAIATLGSSLLFGLAPALMGARGDGEALVKEGGRGAPEGRGGQRLRRMLVVLEFALSLVLLAGAGLLLRSFAKLEAVDPGVRTSNVLTASIALPTTRYGEPAAIIGFHERLLAAVRTLPGVRSAAILTGGMPPNQQWNANNFVAEGQPWTAGQQDPIAGDLWVGGDYFETLGIPLLRGRTFNDHDTPDSPPVVIVNEALARRFLPGQDAVGKRLRLGDTSPTGAWVTIVGVAANAKYTGLDSGDELTIYSPFRQSWSRSMSLIVHTTDDPRSLVAALRRQLAGVDSELVLSRVATMTELMRDSLARARFRTTLLTLFAAAAALLAAVGIYGVMAYAVSRRTREIGIRMALGARHSDVLAGVFREGLTLALGGVGVGLVGALAVTRITRSLLFGVSATDPLTFAAVAMALAGVAALACYVPARRATRVDPMAALRGE